MYCIYCKLECTTCGISSQWSYYHLWNLLLFSREYRFRVRAAPLVTSLIPFYWVVQHSISSLQPQHHFWKHGTYLWPWQCKSAVGLSDPLTLEYLDSKYSIEKLSQFLICHLQFISKDALRFTCLLLCARIKLRFLFHLMSSSERIKLKWVQLSTISILQSKLNHHYSSASTIHSWMILPQYHSYFCLSLKFSKLTYH